MKKMLEIAWKDNLLRFSSWTELLFFLILPVIFSVFLSGAFGGSDDGEVDSRIPVFVVNEDGSELASTFLNRIDDSGVVRQLNGDGEAARAAFDDGDVSAILTIPAGFGETLAQGQPLNVQLEARPGNLNVTVAEQAIFAAADVVGQSLAVAAASVAAAEALAPFADDAERQAYFAASLLAAQDALADRPDRIRSTQSEAANTEAESFDPAPFIAAGQLVTWVFIPLLGASGVYAYERTQGTLRRMVTTPTGKITFLGGTIIGQLGAAILQMIILITIGTWLGINWGDNYLGLGIMIIAFGLAGVAFGTMLATFIRTPEQANGTSILLGMTLSMLGGCWFPLENFPAAAQRFAQLLPTTHAMSGFSDMIVRGQGIGEIMPEVGILLGFMVVFLAIGVARFRYE